MPVEPLRLQAVQAPLHAELQQIPWAQKVDWHSLPAPQEAPPGFLPQEPAMQVLGA
jgi:hypothetical protein